MNEIQPVLDLLSGKFHWLPTLITWIGAAKLLFHFVGGYLQSWAAGLLVKIVDSPDPDDDHFLLVILTSPFYKFTRFLLQLFSLPLPSKADYDAALNSKGQTNTAALSVLLVFLGLGMFGCATAASVNSQIFNSENLAADLASDATSAFNAYYVDITNSLSADDLAKLNSTRAQLYAADKDLSASLSIVDSLRENYATNSTTAVLAAVNAALITAQTQSSNIVVLVNAVTGAQ